MVLTGVCGCSVASLLFAEFGAWKAHKAISKTLASASFVAVSLCFFAATSSDQYRWIVRGLVLGAAGDVALLFVGQAAFLTGLSLFLAGHVAYVIAFAIMVPPSEWAAVSMFALGAFGAAVLAWLYPRLGPMRVPVIAYVAVICTMVVAALSLPGRAPGGVLLACGAGLFAVSDLAVARERFVSDTFVNKAWGLPTYYAGQLCVAWAVSYGMPS